MGAPIPTNEPETFSAGDSLSWKKSLADFVPADGYSLTYCFRGLNLTSLDVTSTASGATHLVTIATDASASLIPGEYTVAGYAVKSGERVEIYRGTVAVTQNIFTIEAGKDTRTQARRILDNVEAVIEGRASSSILGSTVDGTRLDRIPMVDLIMLRDKYKQLVLSEQQLEKIRSGRAASNSVFTRFQNAR